MCIKIENGDPVAIGEAQKLIVSQEELQPMEKFFQTQLQHIIDPSCQDIKGLLMTEKKQRKGMEQSKSLSNIKKPKVGRTDILLSTQLKI